MMYCGFTEKITEGKFLLSTENQVQPAENDFLEVLLENEEIVLNAMQIVQKKFPNTLSLPLTKSYFIPQSATKSEAFRQITETELFMDFFKKVQGKELDAEKVNLLREAIKQAKADEK